MNIATNNRFDPLTNSNISPFVRDIKPSQFPKKAAPIVTPPPPKNPWHRKKIFVYHDSNLLRTKDHVKEELRRVGTIVGNREDYDIEFLPTMSVAQTHMAIKKENHPCHRNHRDSIVIINVGTNDIRHKFESPEDPRSKKNTLQLLQKAISLLKEQTDNIIVLESPPATKFHIAPYNQAVYNMCQAEGIHFAYTLVGHHDISHDGYHVKLSAPLLVPRSVAAAVYKVLPFRIYDHPRPQGNYRL